MLCVKISIAICASGGEFYTSEIAPRIVNNNRRRLQKKSNRSTTLPAVAAKKFDANEVGADMIRDLEESESEKKTLTNEGNQCK